MDISMTPSASGATGYELTDRIGGNVEWSGVVAGPRLPQHGRR